MCACALKQCVAGWQGCQRREARECAGFQGCDGVVIEIFVKIGVQQDNTLQSIAWLQGCQLCEASERAGFQGCDGIGIESREVQIERRTVGTERCACRYVNFVRPVNALGSRDAMVLEDRSRC